MEAPVTASAVACCRCLLTLTSFAGEEDARPSTTSIAMPASIREEPGNCTSAGRAAGYGTYISITSDGERCEREGAATPPPPALLRTGADEYG